MIVAVLLSLAILSCANALKPKVSNSWPIQAEWLLLPSNPALNQAIYNSNFEVIPTLRFSSMVPVIIEQVPVHTGSYVYEGDVILTVSVQRAGELERVLYDIASPVSGNIGVVYVQEGELAMAKEALMDLIEQELHARPVPFQPNTFPQPANPAYGSRPSYRPKPPAYGNYGNGGREVSVDSDLNMIP